MLGRLLGAALVATAATACGSGVDGPEAADGGTGASSVGGQGGAGVGGSGAGAAGGGGASACDPPAEPDVFEIGTGEACFERLSANQPITLMNGPQGGYHVWLAVGCSDCAAPTNVWYGVRDPATGAMLANTYDSQTMVQLAGSPWGQAARIIVYMPGVEWDPDLPALPEGTPFVLWVEVHEGDVVKHAAEIPLVIGETVVWDPCPENPDDPACQLG